MWNARDSSAVDRFVADDFVIVTGGVTVSGYHQTPARVRRQRGYALGGTPCHRLKAWQNVDVSV